MSMPREKHKLRINLKRLLSLHLRLILDREIALIVAQSLTESHLTLCDPMDCTPPGFSVHGILQARILGWVAIPFSRGPS